MVEDQSHGRRVLGASGLLSVHFIEHPVREVTVCLEEAEPLRDVTEEFWTADGVQDRQGDQSVQEAQESQGVGRHPVWEACDDLVRDWVIKESIREAKI